MTANTVLVADDMPMMRVLMTRVLARGGFEVIEASDGLEAVDVASACQPALAILDWHMPRLSGLDACRQLRANALLADMTVVILSGGGDGDERAAALSVGADDYLLKPIEAPALLGRIRDLLAAKAV